MAPRNAAARSLSARKVHVACRQISDERNRARAATVGAPRASILRNAASKCAAWMARIGIFPNSGIRSFSMVWLTSLRYESDQSVFPAIHSRAMFANVESDDCCATSRLSSRS